MVEILWLERPPIEEIFFFPALLLCNQQCQGDQSLFSAANNNTPSTTIKNYAKDTHATTDEDNDIDLYKDARYVYAVRLANDLKNKDYEDEG